MVDLGVDSVFRRHSFAIKADKSAFVFHLVAVVRCAEDSNDSASLLHLVAIVFNLVRADEHL